MVRSGAFDPVLSWLSGDLDPRARLDLRVFFFLRLILGFLVPFSGTNNLRVVAGIGLRWYAVAGVDLVTRV
jgi:hypothetical protein